MNETRTTAQPRETRMKNWRQSFSREELDSLLEIEDWRGWFTVIATWAQVALAFAIVAVAPGFWWTAAACLLALFVIGTRQLGMAVIMHEAAHHTLFENRKLNNWVGNWLAAYPVWADVHPYRSYHLKHHAHTGGPGDPDLGLVAPFPITRDSLWRKVWRDLSGQTGWKQAVAVAKRDLGMAGRKTQRDFVKSDAEPDVGWHKIAPVVVSNAVLFGILALAGHPALYLLWVISWLTTYRLVTRIRSIAEHAMARNAEDPFLNTRTTETTPLSRLFIAPNRVNYHLEHHLLMTVPHYNLPRFHEMLREKGLLEGAFVSDSYFEVLREASSRPY